MKVAVHAGQLLQPVPGGIGRYVTHLLASLPGAGVAPVAFAAGPEPRAGSQGAVAPWVDLGWPRGSLRYELWHRARRPSIDIDADVVHATSLAIPPPGRRPLVVTVHDVVFLRQPDVLSRRGIAFHRRGLELARREAAAVIVPTAFGKSDLVAEGFDAERVHVAPHGVDVPAQPSSAPPPVDGRYLLFVSTLEPRKGVNDLLDAHQRLRRAHPDLQLVLAGPTGWGEPADTDRPGVTVTGHLDDERLDAAYRAATMLVVPERYAGFGMPIIEAMARRCPVITSDAACLPEVGGGASLVVPTGDVAALADAIDGLLRDDGLRVVMAETGVSHAAAFTWARSAVLHAVAYRAAQERT